jgi:hypothetical protein
MNLKALVKSWEDSGATPLTTAEYAVRLPIEQAARLAALAEMYPLKTQEQIVTELLGVVLDELLQSFPYVSGPRVIATDDMGDAIYEDIGRTPAFLELTRKHREALQQE